MKARSRAFILSLLVPLALRGQEIGLVRLGADRPVQGSAQLYGGYEAGGFHPAFAPSSQWKAGASAQGVRHGVRTSFTGAFSFEQVEGKDMFTSMFLEPGYIPVDVLEFTPGDKTRQTYRLDGGFLTEFAEGFGAGVKTTYSAANYAKRKDIRHTTYGMSLRVEPTFSFFDESGGGAIAYVFQKMTESIDSEQVGSAADQSYYAFLDKGMRYGTYQVWDGDGIHLDEAGVGIFPVREYSHGFATSFNARGALSGGTEFLWKHGTVGEKGYNWFRYPGFLAKGHLERTWRRESADHALRIGLEIQSDQLKEAVLDKKTEGGVTTPVVYAYNAVSDRSWGSLDLSYRIRFREGALRMLQASLRGGAWTEKSYLMYPYKDKTDRYNGTATLSAAFGFGPIDLNVRALGGIGSWKEQGLSGGTDTVESKPFRLQADWDRKMEYFSTPRLGGGLTLTYHLKAVKGLYLQAEGSWLHGFGIVLLPGADRGSATLRLGYGF
ncbi:MAG: hypothetical protein IKN06_12675 [Bacteroidales bacterium]|nr:hypothetical protein [Bacteroidales bacterium]